MHEGTSINVFETLPKFRELDSRDEARVSEIIRRNVLPATDVEYSDVKVKIRRHNTGRPRHLIAYLLRRDTYTADVVRVVVDPGLEVQQVEMDYRQSTDPKETECRRQMLPKHTVQKYDLVFGTPRPGSSSAARAVRTMRDIAREAGHTVKTLIAAEATVENYKTHLASGAFGFVSIGHGTTESIVLENGTLDSSWFCGLPPSSLTSSVIYLNSCRVFSTQFRTAILGAGARTFVGGVLELAIDESENVTRCFWGEVLSRPTPMGKALRSRIAVHYSEPDSWGMAGDCGPFHRRPHDVMVTLHSSAHHDDLHTIDR